MVSARSRWWLLETLRGGCALAAVRARVCLCVCLCDRGRERPVYAPSGAPRTIPDEAEKTWMLCFYQSADRPPSLSLSLSLCLPPSLSLPDPNASAKDPVVPFCCASSEGAHQFWECEMSHYKVCTATPPRPPPWKWIDPKWDQQASSSLFIDRLPHTGWNLSR